MTEKKTTTRDPEELSPEERRAILQRHGARIRRQLENEIIANELAREAQEAERRESS